MRKSWINRAYWICTALIALNWTFGGITGILQTSESNEVYNRLGYPSYFSIMLGIGQLLAVVAILAPAPRAIREWAYAGLAFDVIAAIFSLIAIKSAFGDIVIPFIALITIMISYFTWKRRLVLAAT